MPRDNCTIVGRRTGDGAYDASSSAYVGYGSSTTFYPYALKFTLPSFTGASSAIEFSLSMYGGYRNGSKSSAVNLRWALCSSDANINSYNTAGAVADPNQIVSGTITFDGLNSSTSVIKTLSISAANLKPGVSYYLILWGNNSFGYSGDTATMNAASKHSAVLVTADSFKLYINQGEGSIISVKRNGSALSNDSTITHGDVLIITFGTESGYDLSVHTVNGVSFTSGKTHTVTGDVTVVATATKKTFKLTINQGIGSSVEVKRNGTALASGAAVTYGDVLTVTFGVETGYGLTSHTVNGSVFTSGNSHTVTGDVTVVVTAAVLAYALSIDAAKGTSIFVNRTKSPKAGAGTGALSHGSEIYHGDELNIGFDCDSLHAIASHTVNGSPFAGGSWLVSGAVSVKTTGKPVGTINIQGRAYRMFLGMNGKKVPLVNHIGKNGKAMRTE